MGKRYGVGLRERWSTTLGLLPGPLPIIMVPGISGQEACCLSSMQSPSEDHAEPVLGQDDTEPHGWVATSVLHLKYMSQPSNCCRESSQKSNGQRKTGQAVAIQMLREKPSGDVQRGGGIPETLSLSSGERVQILRVLHLGC